MLDLGQMQQQMNTAEQGLNQYRDPNLMSQVNQQVAQQWNPVMQNAANSTQQMMSDFLPRYMNIPYTGLAAGNARAGPASPPPRTAPSSGSRRPPRRRRGLRVRRRARPSAWRAAG